MSPRRAKAVVDRVGDDPAAALRDHLVDVVARLTAEAPLATITTREIARSAGVSDGVLYNYFADKQELLAEALLRRFRHLFEGAAMRIPEPGTGTVEDNIGALAASLFDLECEVIPMLAGLLADPPLFHRMFASLHEDPRGPEWFREPLAAYIEGERQLGRVRADVDPASISLLLLGATSLLALVGQLGPAGRPEQAERVRPVVAELLRGLRPAEA